MVLAIAGLCCSAASVAAFLAYGNVVTCGMTGGDRLPLPWADEIKSASTALAVLALGLAILSRLRGSKWPGFLALLTSLLACLTIPALI